MLMTNEELVYLYQQGDEQALNELIEKNKGIVYKLVNKFYVDGTSSIDKEDLEQEGFIGLITGVKKYDFNNPKKAQFTTYAVHWIYSKIHRYITQKNTNDETSLNIPIGQDRDIEILDTVESVDYSLENVEEKLYYQQLRQELNEVMDTTNTLREREVLKLHYGWDNNKCFPLDEIGYILDIEGKGVKQIETKAMTKIRQSKWGRLKAKEMYDEKKSKAIYSISDFFDSISFAERYL